MLTEDLEKLPETRADADERVLHSGLRPLFGISVFLTLVLGLLSSPGPVSAPISALVTGVLVIALSLVALRPVNRRVSVPLSGAASRRLQL